MKFVRIEHLGDQSRNIAAQLIVQSIPEFYECFSLEYNDIRNQLSTDLMSSLWSGVSTTEGIIHNGSIVGIISALPAKALKTAQIYSTRNLLSLVKKDIDTVKLRLKSHSCLIQPILDDSFYLSRIAVSRKHQGNGFGTAALNRFIHLGSSYEKLSLHVHIKNIKAISIYRKAGFKFENTVGWEYAVMSKTG